MRAVTAGQNSSGGPAVRQASLRQATTPPATPPQATPPRAPPPPCPHRPACTGCPRYADPRISQAASVALAQLASAHGLADVPLVNGAAVAFRSRARLAIRGRVASPKIGLFAEGTHRVVHIPQCRIHHPLINRVAHTVREALIETRVPCYSEATHQGLARYLQVAVERRSQSAQVVLVANRDRAEPLLPALQLIRAHLDHELHSLWFSSQCERSNAILGPALEHIAGPESIIECFGGAEIHYPPGAFGQSNLEVAGEIIAELRREVPGGARVAEFYGGVGAIGLSLIGQLEELRINEAAPASLQGLQMGLAGLDARLRTKVSVVPGPAALALDAAAGADVIIVDPPRKGLDEPLARHLAKQPPPRLLYLSCDLHSLLRDTAQLLAPGRLRLTALTAFNQMPYTDHVETLARFES